MTETTIRRYDFTFHTNEEYWKDDKVKLDRFCTNRCAHWVYQLERAPTTDRLHFQGRVSLKTKARLSTITHICHTLDITAHWSPTSNGTKDFDYVMKEDTRVEGPWMDKEIEFEQFQVPKVTKTVLKLKDMGLRAWQQTIVDMSKIYDDRSIDIILDKKGCIGKSAILKYLDFEKLAYQVPTINNMKDLMQAVLSLMKRYGMRDAFVIDFPRGISHKTQNSLWCAIEDIKNGYVYDTRYKCEYIRFDEPRVFVFTNTLPPRYLMSQDRWKYWIVENDELVSYHPNDGDYNELSDPAPTPAAPVPDPRLIPGAYVYHGTPPYPAYPPPSSGTPIPGIKFPAH